MLMCVFATCSRRTTDVPPPPVPVRLQGNDVPATIAGPHSIAAPPAQFIPSTEPALQVVSGVDVALAVRIDAGEPDAGEPDAGDPDAGEPDAGDPDAGEPDAGEKDAGEPDAGELDAGPPDAGPPDAGEEPIDAGPVDAGWVEPIDAGVPDAGSIVTTACLKILPLGDSITLGANGGYRNSLFNQLTMQGCGVDLVGTQVDTYTLVSDKNHEGHVGFGIADIRGSVDGWISSAAPDYVLLLIGTNDIAWFTSESASQIADRHAALMDRIMADRPSAWLVVGSIPPISSKSIPPTGIDRAVLARNLNVEIASRVQSRLQGGKKIRFADVGGMLTVSDLYDGVHPTLAASSKMTTAWMQALTPLFTCGVAGCGQ
jgi:hypothetical protein